MFYVFIILSLSFILAQGGFKIHVNHRYIWMMDVLEFVDLKEGQHLVNQVRIGLVLWLNMEKT